MREIITIILFFSLVGWIQILFLNEVWKEVPGIRTGPGSRQQRIARAAPADAFQTPKHRRLPLRILWLRSTR